MEIVEVSSRSGKVHVVAEDRGDVVVKGATVERREGTLAVRGGSHTVEVRCPVGTDLRIGVASGGVSTEGALGDVRVTSASGSVKLDAAASADVRSASGSVRIGRCDGTCRVSVKSGHVEVGRAGRLEASAKSGRVTGGPVDSAEVHVASGHVELEATGSGDLEILTHSGSVEITLPPGVCPRCDVQTRSGRFHSDCETGEDLLVTVRATSGSVDVRVA
jgi:DUF4097 and DUF4098 domain-containing protein YvlB